MPEIKIAQEIMARQKKFEQIRKPCEEVWEDIAEYIIPFLEFMKLDYTKGKKIGTKSYDGTGINALNILVNGFQGYMVALNLEWFMIAFMLKELNTISAAETWAEDVTDYLYSVFENSNFYGSINQNLRFGFSIGTATIYVDDDYAEGNPLYIPMHPKEIYIAEDHRGKICTVHRKYRMTARNALERFKDNGDKLTKDIRQAADRPESWDKEFTFIHAVDKNVTKEYGKLDFKNKEWRSFYIQENGTEVLSEGGYDENPYIVWRCDKIPDEVYGRSQAHYALVDVMKLSQMEKTTLKARHKAVDPPYMVPESHRGRVQLGPGDKNYYQDLAREKIEPILTHINMVAGIEGEERVRKIIRDHFMVDFFMMLQEPGKITATEVMELQGEKAVILGTTVGQLETEMLDPLISRTFNIESRAGRLPPLPEELLEYGGSKLKINYLGPLALIQRRTHKQRGVIGGLRTVAPFMQIYPELKYKFKPFQIAEEIADAHGMPERVMRSDEEAAEIMRQTTEAAQEQAQMERLGQMADVAGKVNKRVEPGSILERAMGR